MTTTSTLSARIPDRREVRVEAPEAGERLDRVLASRLQLSRSRLKALIEAGHVAADGATIRDPSAKVKPGQAFVVEVPPPEPDRPEPQAIPLDIRYEDEHLLVLEKPAGLVVHPAPGNPDLTLVNALLAHCGEALSGIGGVKRPGIVHRLDKDTSGLMVVAKSELAQNKLAAAFAAREIDRAYLALVWGVPLPRVGEITGNIGRSRTNRQKMAVVASGGKPAITRYKVLREWQGLAALVECRLATGRTHQIRVHLAAKGHPLVGDPVYGSGRQARRATGPAGAALARFPRQALHAYRLGFVHPATGERLAFEGELPADMAAMLRELETL
ncbi:MAG: RluA family pseudouridine synthase [Rhodospirillales bacterium]|nr:RluA family pseudouridine synthase [Rhodospirillales bacterium]